MPPQKNLYKRRTMDTKLFKMLNDDGAVVENTHVAYSKNLHGSVYINEEKIYSSARRMLRVGRAIADHFLGDHIEVVLGPLFGGAMLAPWVAYHLPSVRGNEVPATYAVKIPATETAKSEFFLRVGYEALITGKNVLIMDDIVTTGESSKKLVELVRFANGHVAGMGVMWNRGNVTKESVGNIPRLVSLIDIQLASWDPASKEKPCPLCRQGAPLSTTLGYGSELWRTKLKLQTQREKTPHHR